MSVDRRRRIDFFVSYTGSDTEWAEWIAWELKESGFQVRLQKWHFEPGSDFMSEMNEAVTKAHRTIAVLSPAYLKSAYCRAEWQSVFTTDVDGRGRRLVPVCIEKCSQKELGLLRSRVYIDLTKCENDESARQTLLNGLKGGEPDTAPTFPGELQSGSSDTDAHMDESSGDTVLRQPKRYPGTLPAVWTVGHQRNRDFTGREEILESVRSELSSGRAAAVTQAIAGLGGVGKTQLAIEYAYRHAAEYDAVLWVGADGAEQAAANLAQQAVAIPQLGVTVETPQDDALRAVLAWLEHTPGWLLIFDNANHPNDVGSLLPRSLGLDGTGGRGGHVLITSRHRDWSGTAQSVGVPVWSREESLQFVQERTGRDLSAASDTSSADALCEALGDLPLAVAQACGYLTATEATLAEYLELFQTRRADLWKQEQDTTSPPDEYHSTVATTWSLALDRLPATAVALLRVCSCLAPEPIPGWLFQTELPQDAHESQPADLQTVLSDRLAYQAARAALLSYSLLEITDSRLQVHRLVQTVVRDSLPDDESWPKAVLCLVDAAVQFDEHELSTWEPTRELMPHVFAVVSSPSADSVPDHAGQLIYWAAQDERLQGRYASARDLMQRAIAIDEKAYEPDHPNLAADYSSLAMIEKGLGSLPAAQHLMLRAIAIEENVYGPDHPDLAIRYSNLAMIEQDLGNLCGARQLIELAVAIDEKVYEPDHPHLARSYSIFALIEKDLGALPVARDLMQRAITIQERAYAPSHPYLGTSCSNLALIERDLKSLPAARDLMQRAIAILEQAYAPDHFNLAFYYQNLAMIERDLGALSAARDLMQRAIAIQEQVYEPDHPDLALRYRNLGLIEQDDGNIEQARTLIERAHTAYLQRLGPQHPKTEDCATWLSEHGGLS